MAKVRHAVILSRYSGAIIGASAGLAAAICFVVILAGFPHKSVPEMVSSVPPEITSSVSTAVQTTGSSKAVTEPATTAPTTSSSQQTVSAEPVTSTDEPVEITEQAPASEPDNSCDFSNLVFCCFLCDHFHQSDYTFNFINYDYNYHFHRTAETR